MKIAVSKEMYTKLTESVQNTSVQQKLLIHF
nr:MAG TPA: hypothetical protein [Caudoviricetes sp.]